LVEGAGRGALPRSRGRPKSHAIDEVKGARRGGDDINAVTGLGASERRRRNQLFGCVQTDFLKEGGPCVRPEVTAVSTGAFTSGLKSSKHSFYSSIKAPSKTDLESKPA
jgi:hypothetical protein